MANHYKKFKTIRICRYFDKYIPNSLKIIDNKIEQTRKTLGNKKILRVINNLGSVDLSIRIKYALEEFLDLLSSQFNMVGIYMVVVKFISTLYILIYFIIILYHGDGLD